MQQNQEGDNHKRTLALIEILKGPLSQQCTGSSVQLDLLVYLNRLFKPKAIELNLKSTSGRLRYSKK